MPRYIYSHSDGDYVSLNDVEGYEPTVREMRGWIREHRAKLDTLAHDDPHREQVERWIGNLQRGIAEREAWEREQAERDRRPVPQMDLLS